MSSSQSHDDAVQIVAEHSERLTLAAMKDMRYTEACVKEALRMIPIIGSVCQKLLQDVDVCGYTLKQVGG